jgi:hypothetical protein
MLSLGSNCIQTGLMWRPFLIFFLDQMKCINGKSNKDLNELGGRKLAMPASTILTFSKKPRPTKKTKTN